jgi:Ca-activated chloride channel family protein
MNWRSIVVLAGIVLSFAVAKVAADDPVQIDVIVTDAKSRPIANLKADEFELVDSGEARAVESLQLKSGSGRVVGVLLDDFHVTSGEATSRAKAALSDFVERELRDGDIVAVVKPLDPLHAITFTSNREALRSAIAAFDGRKGDYTPRSEFERNFMSRDPRTADLTRAQVVSAALQALARRLGDQQPGRKALIMVSEGFTPVQPRAILFAANRTGVAVYPIDPSTEATDGEAMLRAMAEQTGGYASINERELVPAFRQALAELDAHYVVAFHSSGSANGQFHPVQIRVKRSGATARARSGYWAPSPDKASAAVVANKSRALPFRPSRSSPYIRPWIGMSLAPDGSTRVTVTWEPGSPPPRNQQLASVDVKATAVDGQVLLEHRVVAGQTSRVTFDSQPGAVALELALESSTGAALDTDYRNVTVPNLRVTKPTLATPQILRLRTARDFAEISVDPNAVPVASRVFSRTERLLVRVPAYGPQGVVPNVTARLLNRRGLPMRDLQPVAAPLPDGPVQFDVPLASLAPDEYRLEVTAANPSGAREEAKELIVFRITN